MQHAGVQYGQGASNSHHPTQQFTPPEVSVSNQPVVVTACAMFSFIILVAFDYVARALPLINI